MDYISELIDDARALYLSHVDTIETALRAEDEAAARRGRHAAERLRRQFWRDAAAIDEEIGAEMDWAAFTFEWEREHKG